MLSETSPGGGLRLLGGYVLQKDFGTLVYRSQYCLHPNQEVTGLVCHNPVLSSHRPENCGDNLTMD